MNILDGSSRHNARVHREKVHHKRPGGGRGRAKHGEASRRLSIAS